MKILQNDISTSMISFCTKILSLFLVFSLALSTNSLAQKKEKMSKKKKKKMKKMKDLAPAKGYIEAHKDFDKPFDLLGGPIEINISQESGGVFVILPSKRELDKNSFGVPGLPRAYAGSPGINGVPPMGREKKGGKYTTTKNKTPFGDKNVVMGGANLNIEALDKTATDAAKTEDKVQMSASWEDKAGNTYKVVCCEKMAAHGMEFPTFGGVATNHILHGFTRIGTALMPSEYTYFAFWGMGAVMKNGEVTDKPRLVHGMLTEYVRGEDYKLVKDENVTPGRRHFHLMVAPMMPDMEKGTFTHKNVKTGFELPNGMELPFWHVMFENLEINGERQ